MQKSRGGAGISALGVSQIHFFGEPDRGLQVCSRLVERVCELIRVVGPASVFIPTPLEYHPDHRATSEIVWRSVQVMGDFSGEVYGYEVSNLAPINLLIDTSAVAAQNMRWLNYASQLTESNTWP